MRDGWFSTRRSGAGNIGAAFLYLYKLFKELLLHSENIHGAFQNATFDKAEIPHGLFPNSTLDIFVLNDVRGTVDLIGHQMGVSKEKVEKDIRDAISKGWRDRDEETWRPYFPKKKKPTNREFIARIAEIIDLWLEMEDQAAKQ